MFKRSLRKPVLILVFLLIWSMAVMPGVALANQSQTTPDGYTLDLELLRVQTLLAAKGFYRGPVNGMENEQMAHAIMTFHKAADLERTDTLLPGDIAILSAWQPQVPEVPDQPNRLEVDLERQVMHLVQQGEVMSTLPISSGNGEWYVSPRTGRWARANTPSGNYTIYYHIPRWRFAPLGGLYKPWYFNGGIAVHGSLSVPAYPASHGCIRVTMDDADWLTQHLSLGLPVNVRANIPREPILLSGNRSFADPLGMYS